MEYFFLHSKKTLESAYRNAVTDHTNVLLSTNYHSKDYRYYLLGLLSAIRPVMRSMGGVPHVFDETWNVVEDGVIRDTAVYLNVLSANPVWNPVYNTLFFKETRSPLLSDAQRQHRVQYAYVDQYFRLLESGDSAKVDQQLMLRSKVMFEINRHRFVDESIDTSSLQNNIVPVYPTLGAGEADIFEGWLSRGFFLNGQVSYSFKLREDIGLQVDGGIDYEQLRLLKDSSLVDQSTTGQEVNAVMSLPFGELTGHLRQNITNVFSPEQQFHLVGDFRPWAQRPVYSAHKGLAKRDTLSEALALDLEKVQRPVSLISSFTFQNLNPSLFQAIVPGDSGNTFQPILDLQNQQITHVDVSLRYDFPTPVGRMDTLLPMYFGARGFLSNAGRMIYYSDSLDVIQAGNGENVSWAGIEASFRLRFFRKFYLETNSTFQIGNTSSASTDLQRYVSSVPQWHGKTDIFYDNSSVTFARRIRLGVSFEYFGKYTGQAYDPVSGEFFPTNYELPPFVKADLYGVFDIMGVNVFVRFSHVNEGALINGYFTTPTYPMLERAFTFGVNWTFFD